MVTDEQVRLLRQKLMTGKTVEAAAAAALCADSGCTGCNLPAAGRPWSPSGLRLAALFAAHPASADVEVEVAWGGRDGPVATAAALVMWACLARRGWL